MTFNSLSLVMGFCYIILGVFVMKYEFFVVQMQEKVAYAFGILLIIYGIFRIIRAILGIKKHRNAK